MESLRSDFTVQVNPGLNGEAMISKIRTKEKVLRVASLVSSSLLAICNCVLLLICISLYLHWRSRTLVFSLEELITCHVVIGCLIAVSISAISFGVMTVRVLKLRDTISSNSKIMKKRLSNVATCQIVGLLFLITVKSGMLFGVITQWKLNLETGISFSVQGYNPILQKEDAINGIQVGLGCCGRESGEDYQISNEYFLKGYVPSSCCDTGRFYLDFCHKLLTDSNEGTKYYLSLKAETKKHADASRFVALPNQTIPLSYAHPMGCYTKMHKYVLPTIGAIFGLLIFFDLFGIFTIIYYLIASKALNHSMEIELVKEVFKEKIKNAQDSVLSIISDHKDDSYEFGWDFKLSKDDFDTAIQQTIFHRKTQNID